MTSSSMTPNIAEQYDYLRAVGRMPDGEIDIARTALMLAALDRPGISFQKYEHHLEILGLDLANEGYKAETAEDRALALTDVMNARHGYEGNEKNYDDLQNANLMSVIDRRLGIPVSLGILYIHAARARGWQAEGVNFPGHFLVRVFGTSDQAIVDPFHSGRLLDARHLRDLIRTIGGDKAELKPEFYAAISDRGILVRMLNNIKVRSLQANDFSLAADVLERMSLIDPEKIEHTYEHGILLAYLGEHDKSRQKLLTCLDKLQDGQENSSLKKHILETLKDLSKATNKNVLSLISNDRDEE
ncbi:transglutaminase-like domain-containing protein [Emcibacter sp.]|uniref:SirB1 family protein n=1 Tax=Emcibacter sp. TaxID=1979954 RepID=UPI002AA7AB98|nr:transglutaminase-like domain-containing protein [Emcibacter sp.]